MFLRKDFIYLFHINAKEWHKLKIYVYSPNHQANRLCKGDGKRSRKKDGIYHRSHEPTIYCKWGNPILCLDQPTTKGRCQPIGGHVSYPIDISTATRLVIINHNTGLILGLRPANALHCNDVFHWLGANLKSALQMSHGVRAYCIMCQ